jgi:serine O-acetyltransferase
MMCLLCGLYWLVESTIAGTEIKVVANIGRSFIIHTSQAILIAEGTEIGDDCTINSGVCIVYAANSRAEGTPKIGNHVYLGVGSKVVGAVNVGNHVLIGANAVVTRDVPAFHVAIGVPAIARPMKLDMLNPMGPDAISD